MVRIDSRVTGERCSLELLLVSSIEPRSAFKNVIEEIRGEYPSAEVREGPAVGFIAYDPTLDFSTLMVDVSSDRMEIQELEHIYSKQIEEGAHTSFMQIRAVSTKSQRRKPNLEPEVHIHFQTDRERSLAQLKQDLPTVISNSVVIPGKGVDARRGDSMRFALKTSVANREVNSILAKIEDIRDTVETEKMFLKCFAP